VRWLMLLILFVVRLEMGFQFQSVASTSAQLVDSFGLSYAQVGTLIGLFLLPGVFISIPSGALTRAFSDKNLLMAGAVAMVIGGWVMGAAGDATTLYAGRLITGVGGTIFNVILTKMVTEWFFEKEIVLALGIMLAAWPCGLALGLVIHGAVAAAYGWSWVMYVTAFAALAALALTALFYRAPPEPLDLGNAPLRYGLPLRELVQMSVVGVAWALYNAVLILVISFTPDALVAAGTARGAAQSITSLFMWTAMISVPVGGRLMQSVKRVTPAIVVLSLVSSAILVFLASGKWAGASLIALGIVGGIPAGAIMALTAGAVRRENRGPGLGVFYTWYFLGMTLLPGVAGGVRDATGSAPAPLLFAALLMVIVVLCVLALRVLQARWPIPRSR